MKRNGATPAVPSFGEIFGGELFEFEHKGFLFLGFNSGPLMRMAYGHVVPQDIRWMTEEMEKNGKDKPVILVTHYPLMEGDVDNWYEVTDASAPTTCACLSADTTTATGIYVMTAFRAY
mgnify:CR=1 FL=1